MPNLLKPCVDWGIDSMDKFKLQWKIFGFLLGFCALLLAILWMFQTVFLSDMYKFIRKVEIDKAIALVEKNINSPSLETGAAKLNKMNYNLTDSLRKTVNRMSELVKNDGYRLEFDCDEDVHIHADEVKITQAFYNLLLNAITYSGEDKTVIVRQTVEGNSVKIEVVDHGEGIEQSDLPYIWDRYYKVDKKHKRPKMGTGLGLSIVKKVIEMHGGKYGVESKAGKGSNFWFSLEYTTS